MHSRRLACFLLGLWLGGGLLLAWVTRENLNAVDRVLAQPDPAAILRIRILGKEETRLLLRYQASEINRSELETWEITQVVLGSLFFFFLLFGTTEGKLGLALALVLLLFVLLQLFLLTPELNAAGKLLDFLTPGVLHTERVRYRIANASYYAIEVAKWAVQFFLAGLLIARSRSRSGNARQ